MVRAHAPVDDVPREHAELRLHLVEQPADERDAAAEAVVARGDLGRQLVAGAVLADGDRHARPGEGAVALLDCQQRQAPASATRAWSAGRSAGGGGDGEKGREAERTAEVVEVGDLEQADRGSGGHRQGRQLLHLGQGYRTGLQSGADDVNSSARPVHPIAKNRSLLLNLKT